MSNTQKGLGALALVGSGEFLPVMNETDLFLLQAATGPAALDQARVVVIPTASGLEENGPQYWTELGLNHFRELGVNVQAASIVTRADASRPEILELLTGADFFYFSGGNPAYLIETLSDTPAWQIIKAHYEAGAVLAGCSAGAMAMSAYTTSIRAAMNGRVEWIKGWGIVSGLVTMPHFDRMANFVGAEFMQKIISAAPDGCRLIGVDEDTALVRTFGPDGNSFRWQVMGRQSVSIFASDGNRQIFASGQQVPSELLGF